MDVVQEEARRKFTAEEVMQMVRAGILDEDDRLELIEGELLVMAPNDPPHAGTVGSLNARLVRAYGAGFIVRVQLPILASPQSMPEPDFAVVRGDDATYMTRHPEGRDCALVIEVSWSSRRRDEQKAVLYAKAGVPVYLRIDVETRELVLREGPSADGIWRSTRTLGDADEVELPESGGVRLPGRDLLPPK